MARTTISIPDALKSEMDQIGEVNWSLVAQIAFRRVVDLEKVKANLTGDDDMSETIQRLKQQKHDYEQQKLAQVQPLALEAGADWAKSRASYEQLASLAQQYESAGLESCVTGLGPALVGYGITEDDELSEAISEANIPPHEFWNWTIGLPDDLFSLAINEVTRDDFAESFFEGALKVWDEIEDKL